VTTATALAVVVAIARPLRIAVKIAPADVLRSE